MRRLARLSLVGLSLTLALAMVTETAEVQTTPSPRVAVYAAEGVGPTALGTAMSTLSTAGTTATFVTPDDVRADALANADVVLFTGGRGSVQGRLLGARGRERVRRFVRRGGGYVGICAGAYLAMQGSAEFHKLAIVAAQNATGDRWRRGSAPAELTTNDSSPSVTLHYENGPMISPIPVNGIDPPVVLARFETEIFLPEHDTGPGEMRGQPAVIAARYGRGRIVLFSPNPTMPPARPELFERAVRWAARRGHVATRLRWAQVFGR